jgi:hypothetical protein
MVTLRYAASPAFSALHSSLVPVVSAEIWVAPHPKSMRYGGVIVQLTITFPTYQPLSPVWPLTVGVIVGGSATAPGAHTASPSTASSTALLTAPPAAARPAP